MALGVLSSVGFAVVAVVGDLSSVGFAVVAVVGDLPSVGFAVVAVGVLPSVGFDRVLSSVDLAVAGCSLPQLLQKRALAGSITLQLTHFFV